MGESCARVSKKGDKRRFKDRRRALLSSAEAVLRSSAKVFIVVRRSNDFYCYNSEETQTWLPWDEGNVRPLFQRDESEAQTQNLRGKGASAPACDELTSIGGCQMPPTVISNYNDCQLGTFLEPSNIEVSFPALGKGVRHNTLLPKPPIYGSKIANSQLKSSTPPIYDIKAASKLSGSAEPPIMRRFSACI